MSIVAHTIIRPLSGKRQAAESRIRQVSGIYARHGAAVKTTKVVAGPHAGCLAMLRGYPDFKTAVKTLQAVNADPAYLEFEREREANPQAELVSGRNISRRIFGEGRWATHPVTLARGYELTRDKLPEALKLLGELSTLLSDNDVNVIGLIPITGDNMSSLMVSYQFQSMDHLGDALDTVGVSAAFQAIVAKAAAIGTLRSAWVMVPI